ncbi:protein ORF2 [Cyprinid herpesvirus 3]|nr:protein ORF2 [Cyprinid herpesvirus 3]AOO33345.1 protein ORF2 [Cyprinid herpesvirus 3]
MENFAENVAAAAPEEMQVDAAAPASPAPSTPPPTPKAPKKKATKKSRRGAKRPASAASSSAASDDGDSQVAPTMSPKRLTFEDGVPGVAGVPITGIPDIDFKPYIPELNVTDFEVSLRVLRPEDLRKVLEKLNPADLHKYYYVEKDAVEAQRLLVNELMQKKYLTHTELLEIFQKHKPRTVRAKELYDLGYAIYSIAGSYSQKPDDEKDVFLEKVRAEMVDDELPMLRNILRLGYDEDEHIVPAPVPAQETFDMAEVRKRRERDYLQLRAIGLILMRAAVVIETERPDGTYRYSCGTRMTTASAMQVCIFLGRPIFSSTERFNWLGSYESWTDIWFEHLTRDSSLMLDDIFASCDDSEISPATEASVHMPSVHDYAFNHPPNTYNPDIKKQWQMGKLLVEIGAHAVMRLATGVAFDCSTMTVKDIPDQIKALRTYATTGGITSRFQYDDDLFFMHPFTLRQVRVHKIKLIEKRDAPVLSQTMIQMATNFNRNHRAPKIIQLGHNMCLAAHLELLVMLDPMAPLAEHNISSEVSKYGKMVTGNSRRCYIDLTKVQRNTFTEGKLTCTGYGSRRYADVRVRCDVEWMVGEGDKKALRRITSPVPIKSRERTLADLDAEIVLADS